MTTASGGASPSIKSATYDVSTIFLGIDYNWGGEGQPILFETMIFKRSEAPDTVGMGHYQRRWTTRQAARDGHRMVCDALTERLGIAPLSVIDTAPRAERGYLH